MKLKNCILLIIMVAAQLSFAQKNKPKKTGIISSDSFKIIQSSLMYKIKYEGLNRVIESKVQMLTEDFTKLDTLLSVDSLREAFFRNELPTIDLQEVQIQAGEPVILVYEGMASANCLNDSVPFNTGNF